MSGQRTGTCAYLILEGLNENRVVHVELLTYLKKRLMNRCMHRLGAGPVKHEQAQAAPDSDHVVNILGHTRTVESVVVAPAAGQTEA